MGEGEMKTEDDLYLDLETMDHDDLMDSYVHQSLLIQDLQAENAALKQRVEELQHPAKAEEES